MCEKTELVACVDCGYEFDPAELVEIDGELYCDDCVVTCDSCGHPLPMSAAREADCGGYYCEDCYSDNFYCCDHCGCEVAADDAKSVGHNIWCESCYDDKYTTCADCGAEISREDSYTSEGGSGPYCESCYSEAYTSCSACGCELYREDAHCGEYDYFCDDCWRDENGSDAEWDSTRVARAVRFDRIKSTRAYGVELETDKCPDHAELEGNTVFGAKHDGSISGKEFVSPPLMGDEGLEHIERFCRKANGKGFEVSRACGYHLHLDMSHECIDGLKSIAYAYYMTREVWSAFVNKSRRGNSYCGPIAFDVDAMQSLTNCAEFTYFARSLNRYSWFNVVSYARHTTFEIRLHSGTLDARKVCNWVVAHTRFADWAAQHSIADIYAKFSGDAEARFEAVAEIWGDAELTEFYRERARKFGVEFAAEEVEA